MWNLAPAAFYEEGSAYPWAPVSRQHRVNARHPIAGWSTIRVDHLATGSVAFAPGAGTPAGTWLRLAMDAPGRGTGSAARVLILMRSGSLRMVTVSLDVDGDADLRVPFSAAQVSRVVLVFANASTSFRCWTGAGYSCNGRSRADGMPFSYLAALVR